MPLRHTSAAIHTVRAAGTVVLLTVAVCLALAPVAAAQSPPPPTTLPPEVTAEVAGVGTPDAGTTAAWRHALMALPLAAAFGAALAFRPVRRGTPRRDSSVIQTQIVLAVVGALVMIIVGASLARAFGIAGAASLVRYRAKIADPKDAAVMLTSLAVGLATGTGAFALAAGATVFMLLVLWAVESIEPEIKVFVVKATGEGISDLRSRVEAVLRGHKLRFEMRASSPNELAYEVRLPTDMRTDRISKSIAALREKDPPAIEWDEK